jgi:hypothetical protein
VRAVTPLVTTDTLKLIYFAYFHSIMFMELPFGILQQHESIHHPKEDGEIYNKCEETHLVQGVV